MHSGAGGQSHSSQAAWLAAAVVVCLAAAVLVAALAAPRLRRWRRRRGGRRQHEEQPLVPFAWAQHSSDRSSGPGSASERGHGAVGRQARLTELVARRQRRVEMQPLHGVPGQQTYSLPSDTTGSAPYSSFGSSSASDEGPLLAAAHRLGSEPLGPAGGAAEPAGPVWPLPTDSLRLAPQALEVRPWAAGLRAARACLVHSCRRATAPPPPVLPACLPRRACRSLCLMPRASWCCWAWVLSGWSSWAAWRARRWLSR